MLVHFLFVFVARVIGRHFHRGVLFHVFEEHRVAKLRGDFHGVENVEQNHFVAAVTQGLYNFDDLLGLFVKIRNDYDYAAPFQELLKVEEGLGEVRARFAFGLCDRMQDAHHLALPGGWRDVTFHVFVEHDQARRIALLRRHVSERRGHIPRVIDLANLARAVCHRRAGIEQDQQLHIRLALEALQVEAFGASEDVPIDVPEIVALYVLLVFGELLAEAELGGAMKARDEAVDHGLRYEVERRDGGEDGGIEKLLDHRVRYRRR